MGYRNILLHDQTSYLKHREITFNSLAEELLHSYEPIITDNQSERNEKVDFAPGLECTPGDNSTSGCTYVGNSTARCAYVGNSTAECTTRSDKLKYHHQPTYPKQNQIFSGLVIIFYPPSFSKKRLLRTERAREQGATVVHEYDKSVTHMLVGERVRIDEILRHFQWDQMPPNLLCVHEEWLVACLTRGARVSTSSPVYNIQGLQPYPHFV